MPSSGGYKKIADDEDNSLKREQRKRWKAKAKKVAKSVKKTLLGEAKDCVVGLSYYCSDKGLYVNAKYGVASHYFWATSVQQALPARYRRWQNI